MAFGMEIYNDIVPFNDDRELPSPTRVPTKKKFKREVYPIARGYTSDRDTLPRPDSMTCYLRTPNMVSAYDRRWTNLPRPENPFEGDEGRFTVNSLAVMDGLGDLEGLKIGKFFKRAFKPVARAVTAPIRVVKYAARGKFGAAAGTLINPFAKREETVGRIGRRAGGVITGAAAGFVAGGFSPVGAIAGGVTGGLKAKKGVKGFKGYGRVALTGAAIGGAASVITGYGAGMLAKGGIISSQTAANATLASGKLGMWGMGVAGKGVIASTGSALTKIWSGATALLPKPTPSGPVQADDLINPPVLESTPPPSAYSLAISGFPPPSTVPFGYGAEGEPQWRTTLPEAPSGIWSKEPSPFEEEAPAKEKPLLGLKKEHLLLVGGLGVLALAFSAGGKR